MAGKKLSELSSGSLSNLPLSGVTAVVYSGSTFQHTLSHLRSILVDSGSHVFTGSQIINGNLNINGSLIANEYILSSSITNIEVQDVSGSSVFGNDMLDTHQFTGSILVTGSVNASNLVGKEFLFVSGFAVIGDPIHHSGSDPEALHVGTTNSYNIAHFKGDNDYYSQVYIKNLNSGSNASTDFVVVSDNGTETVHFVNLGINSSTYTGGLVGRENDAYLLNIGKDLYIGTVGGVNHPAKLHLFAENNWENPQITIHTGSQVTFNTSSFSDGFMYDFSGSVNLHHNLNVIGSTSGSYFTGSFIGDGAGLYNLPVQTTDVSMFLSSSTFNSFTQSIDDRTDIIETSLSNLPTNLVNLGFSTTSSYFTFNETTMSMSTGENMVLQTSYSGTVIGTDTETATDSQGGQDTLTFSAWIEGSGGIDYPSIVNVQPNWRASGPGLSVGATVASVNTLVFSPGQSVYQITLNTGYGLFQTGEEYTFIEPDTVGTITKNWVFESGGNLIVPNGGNIIGASNLATTGSNTFSGSQIVLGDFNVENNFQVFGDSILEGNTLFEGPLTASNGVYSNLIYPLSGSDTITIDSPNLNVDTITANSLVVTGSVSGDGFDRFATTGSNTFIGDQQITGSVYIDITDSDRNIYFSINGDTNTYIGTTMGNLTLFDGTGYIQLNAQNQDGSGNYSYLVLNANNDDSLFFVGDNTTGRLNASINLSTSGSFNISTDNNTATLLLDGVSYDAHLATTGSNTFTGNQTITGSVDISGSATLNDDNIVSSNTVQKIETITSSSYASITPVSGTLYIIID